MSTSSPSHSCSPPSHPQTNAADGVERPGSKPYPNNAEEFRRQILADVKAMLEAGRLADWEPLVAPTVRR
jgi:hypothetical protein